MSHNIAKHLFSGNAGTVIDLEEHARILHVEIGNWPSAARQQEIHDFYKTINITIPDMLHMVA
jgi:ribosomal protein L21E